MATLKQRLHKKNSSGSYDTVHLETSASLVLMANGTTVESAVNGKAASSHTHSGYASSSHSHAATDITSGTLPLTRGGTGVTSIDALKTALGIGGSGGGLSYSSFSISNKTVIDGTYTTIWSSSKTVLFYLITSVSGSVVWDNGEYSGTTALGSGYTTGYFGLYPRLIPAGTSNFTSNTSSGTNHVWVATDDDAPTWDIALVFKTTSIAAYGDWITRYVGPVTISIGGYYFY